MNSVLLLFIIACILGVVVCIYLGYRNKKQTRAQGLASFAAGIGFEFLGNIAEKPKDKFALVRLFCFHDAGTMENVMKCSDPKLWIFDYEYDIPRDQEVCQTVALFEKNRGHWPAFIIESKKQERFTVAAMRRLTQKLANWQYHFQEIDISFHPQFSNHYRVFCQGDPKDTKALLTIQTLDFLIKMPGWYIETMDKYMLVYKRGNRIKPKELEHFYQSVIQISKVFET